MKYIVYLTTNVINKKIYIGVHKTENPDKFDGYLGCGVKISDRSTYRYCHTPFETAVNKYGPDKFIRKTLKVFDNLQDALDLERWLVDPEFIKRKDTYNITLGGGIPPIKVKTIYQYSLEGDFVKQWDSITEAQLFFKCSNSTIGKAVTDRTPSCGFLWAEYKVNKLNLENFKINTNKIKVYIYDLSGQYIKEFDSITICSEFIGVNSSTLSNAIKGKYRCAQYYVSDFKYDSFPIPIREYHKNDKLYQYDINGNFIKEWDNFKQVCEFFGKNLGIHSAIKLGHTCEGYQWSWEKLPNMKNLGKVGKAKKVGKYTKDGNLVQVFNTVREAKKDTCGAPNVLSGKRKTAGGYIWRYIDDE